MVEDVKASVHHIGIAMVGAAAKKKGLWVDPCTEGAPIVWQDLSGRPAISKLN